MASSSRTEAVAGLGELVLIDGSQYLVYGLLHQAVYYCRYSQQAHLAVVFGYFHPLDRVRTVRIVHQGTDEHVLIGQEPWEQLLARLRICSKRCSLSNGTSTMLSSHIHMKVCAPPYHSVSDLSLCGQPLTWDNVFCILSFMRYVSITIV